MGAFRVAKYNPALRLADGSYPISEWTSVSDVGRTYDDRTFACIDYLRIEDEYVGAVRAFLAASATASLRVSDLQLNDMRRLPTELATETAARVKHVFEGVDVSGQDVEWVVRLALREALWCRLEGVEGFYVHFGYDYYMYIGGQKVAEPPSGLPEGIFAEWMESPYQREEGE